MKTELKLRFVDSGADKFPDAVLLSGDNLASLLEEICRWPVPSEDLQIVVLRGGTESLPIDLFVVIPKAKPRIPGLRGHPYYEVGEGFYVPLGSVLWPTPNPEELKALRVYSLSIFHPVMGMFGIEPQERLSISDLLCIPNSDDGCWCGGFSISDQRNRQLRSVRLEVHLQLTEIFGEESRDIGSEPLSDLAPKPLEYVKAVPSRLFQKAFALLAGVLIRLTGLVPRSAHVSPNWVNALEAWARRTFSGLTNELEKQRNSEIERLLALLKENPEEGLKHAISLAQLAQRGTAQPSARLARRALDFNLRRLGGGLPGDNWSLSNTARLNLIQSYRANAQREIQLGRHRRAAFIFAELLGDLPSAADALKQGRFFREAALIYKEKLKRPLVAAELLALGGLISEAIDIYEQQQCWLEVAPLYEKLGQEKEAEIAYRKAIEKYVAKGDVISASRILDKKLSKADEAIVLLASTWPDGKQAMECLEDRVEILKRESRFRDLTLLLEGLVAERISSNRIAGVISLAVKISQSNTDSSVCRIAKELAIQKTAVVLSDGSFDSAEELRVLKAFTKTAPNDRLLSRDAARFRTAKKSIEVQKRLPPASGQIKVLSIAKSTTHTFPSVSGWFRVSSVENGMVAIARSRFGKYFVTRGTWSGAQQSIEFPNAASERAPVFFCAQRNRVLIGEAFSEGLIPKEMERTDQFGWGKMIVGTPDWLPLDVVAITEGKGAAWAVRLSNGHPILCGYVDGKQIYSRDVMVEIAEAQAADDGVGVFLDAVGGQKSVALGYCHSVLVKTDQNALFVRKFDRPIVGLSPGHPSISGWVVRHDKGASYLVEKSLVISSLDDEMAVPEAIVLRDGRLVLASAECGIVFHVVNGELRRAGSFKIPARDLAIIGMVPAMDSDEFAVAYTDGTFQRFRVGT